MNCGHGHIIYPPCPPDPCTNTVNYTFQNINVLGVGVYDNTTSNVVSFRGVNGDSYISASLDTINHAIQLSLNISAITGGLPAASETQVGKTRFGTAVETAAGLLDTVAVTPQHFIGTTAGLSQLGVIQLASQAEVNAGVNATKAVTPSTLAGNTSSFKVTATTANAVSRGALAPAFVGQVLTQLDTDEVWVATGTSAGNWAGPQIMQGSNTISTTVLLNMGAGEWAWEGVPGTAIRITSGEGLLVDSEFRLSTHTGDSNSQLDFNSNCFVNYNSGSICNFLTGSIIQDNGVTVAANSVLITSGTAGDLSSKLISAFISTSNTQTGYTAFTNPSTIRTCNTATVTLQQLAQLVGTLIEDLKAAKLPAT